MDGGLLDCDGLRWVAMLVAMGCDVGRDGLRCWSRWVAMGCDGLRCWLRKEGCGVIQKPTSYYMHYAACASSSSHRIRTHGSVGKRHVSKSKVSGSNPTSGNCETPPAGIAQRQSVYNIVGRTHRLNKSERLMVIAS